jgi:hypothetical protein
MDAQRAFIGNLKQVTAFLTDPAIKQNVLARVREQISEDTRVVIGHSLGSVVVYEYLCHDRPPSVELLVTLGSPLGIPNVVFDKLTPTPAGGGRCLARHGDCLGERRRPRRRGGAPQEAGAAVPRDRARAGSRRPTGEQWRSASRNRPLPSTPPKPGARSAMSSANRPDPAKRALLAAGTASYDSPHFPALDKVPDALRAVVGALKELGFANVVRAPGYSLDPAMTSLRTAVRKAADAAPVVVLYYTGHGADLERDTYYLVSKKSQPANLGMSALPARDLLTLLTRRDDDRPAHWMNSPLC